MNRKIVVGILAHVDAGKTTLSESLLYQTGVIRKLGRVDSKDAFLDTDQVERARGITIYSKNARLPLKNTEMILIDTPGHIDFSTEMERALSVLDVAILLISGSSGIQPHTRTLWSLLRSYRIPTILFVNKMDMPDTDRETLMASIHKQLSDSCVNFNEGNMAQLYENIATCDEDLMEQFLETETIAETRIQKAVFDRKLFPVYFGSALKMQGIDTFVEGLNRVADYFCSATTAAKSDDNLAALISENEKVGPAGTSAAKSTHSQIPSAVTQNEETPFSARVYKINHDPDGKRLTFLKILSGSLRVKAFLGEEKVNEIRIYSGDRYEAISEAFAGEIACVTGLKDSHNGQIYGKATGCAAENQMPHLTPALSYAIAYPKEMDQNRMLQILKELEEEDPSLNVEYKEQTHEIFVSLMGDVHTEILKSTLQSRYGIDVDFHDGRVCYKETIDHAAIGVGHFEPLRHYAEVHIKLEPLERGSGMAFETNVSEDLLSRNWQRLVLTHMMEREHRGVLLGAPITDMKLTLVAGKAHTKHTEGGDFRQACYRAIRQGLMELATVNACRLLEPYYNYTLEIPEQYVGKAMTDITQMYGTAAIAENDYENHITILTGRAPVSTMNGYMKEVISYTKGLGKLSFQLSGYDLCHNEEEVLAASSYNPDNDTRNPSSSVFCAHGSGTVIPWYEVPEYMHLDYVEGSVFGDVDEDAYFEDENSDGIPGAGGKAIIRKETAALLEAKQANQLRRDRERATSLDEFISTEEIDRILHQNSMANESGRKGSYKGISEAARVRALRQQREQAALRRQEEKEYVYKPISPKDKYMLVDGYNVIHAWTELAQTAARSMPAAVDQLNDILCDYQAMTGINLIAVYDAYRIPGHPTEEIPYQNILQVYTKTAQTADQYIERYAHNNSGKYDITVVTSDGLEQIIIRGEGCKLISSREFELHVAATRQAYKTKYGID